MNFLRGLQSAVNSIPNGGRINHPGQRNNDYIVEVIRSCTYTDDVKFAIEKSVRQLLHVYPQYMVDKIEFAEGNCQKRFIELKGQISVDFKGNLSLFIMYPSSFPKSPPFLRIINPNPQKFSVNASYKKYQSKTDARSYLLNDCLQEAKNWKTSSSVASIIIEVNDLVRTNFPFEPLNQFGNQNQSWGQQQQFQPNYYPPNQQNGSWGQQPPKQPPIPFKAPTSNNYQCTPQSIQEIYAKSQRLVQTQKQKLGQIEKNHTALLSTLQQLQATKVALEFQSKTLNSESEKMTDFMSHSEEHEISNFANLVTPADEISEKLLDTVTSIKAREDTIHILESKFNDEQISLEDFLKNIRKLEEAKFTERYMLASMLQGYSHIRENI